MAGLLPASRMMPDSRVCGKAGKGFPSTSLPFDDRGNGKASSFQHADGSGPGVFPILILGHYIEQTTENRFHG